MVAGVARREGVCDWLGVWAGVPTDAKVGEEAVVEEDTVVEQNGLEGSACWIADEGRDARCSVLEGKGL